MPTESAHNIKSAKKMVERLQTEVWDVLEDVIKEHPVMLNRAPTLHRLGIQAFEPILVEGKAIKLHPLVCTAFNADFDGDQMAVHLPLSVEAQAECRFMLLSPNNLLKPSDGGLVAVPSQDMVLGIYYLTQERPGEIGEGKFFKSVNEAILAYENQIITLHSRIKVRVHKQMPDGSTVTGNVESTMGRFLLNEIIPQDLGFVDRTIPGNELKPEIDFLVKKKQLKQILEKVINTHGAIQTAITLDDIKAIGYKYSTRAAMTVSISDMTVPASKPQLIADAQARAQELVTQHEIMQKAYAQANDTINAANKQAQEILDSATQDANSIRLSAITYTDDMMANIGSVLNTTLEDAGVKYKTFIDSLQSCLDVVNHNRQELAPQTAQAAAITGSYHDNDGAKDDDDDLLDDLGEN